MYDEDNPLLPSSCPMNAWCVKTISRHWADNVSPKPARLRGRGAQRERRCGQQHDRDLGTVPTLLVHRQPVLRDRYRCERHTIHEATATADRSVYGTGYRLKIKTSDGTEVCSASSSSQCGPRTVTVGQTYRAVVEDSQGRNFGDSGALTLTGDGARHEVIDDVDLAYLAAQFGSSSAICNALAEYPGSHLMEPQSTLSDQYRTCFAAASTSTRIDTLRAIAEAVGGAISLGALWYLQREVIRPTPPPGTPWTPDDVNPPSPVPPPRVPPVNRIAETLVQQNPALSQPIADEIAGQCQWSTAPVGLNAAPRVRQTADLRVRQRRATLHGA